MYFFGRHGLQKDMRKAVELYTEAAELGSIQAIYFLGFSYTGGRGVEVDKAKGIQFFTKGAARVCRVQAQSWHL